MWLKSLIITACLAVIVAASAVTYSALAQKEEARQLIPTPRKMRACESRIAEASLYPADKEYPEKAGRFIAVGIVDCEDYGLLSPMQKSTIMKTKLAPFIEAYEEDRDVWRK